MRMFKKIVAMTAALLTAFSLTSTNAYAYDYANYEVNDEGSFMVGPNTSGSVTVEMFMMVDPEHYDNYGFRSNYPIWCSDGEFIWDDGSVTTENELLYTIISQNKKVIETFDGYQIWFWDFRLEPGTYLFAKNNGYTNVVTLTPSLCSPMTRDGYVEDLMYEDAPPESYVTAEAGDDIRLYVSFGEREWAHSEETMESLMAYARMKEESYGNPIVVAESEEPEIIETVEETVEETIEIVETIEESAPVMETTAEPVAEKSKTSPVVFAAILAAIILVAAFIKKKR